jgi:hypothetical protein
VSYLEDLARAIRMSVPADRLPNGEDLDALFLLYAMLVRVKGAATTASDVHDAWAAWMIVRGQQDHESVVPYLELNSATRREDEPFLVAIRSVAASHRA